MLLDLIGHLKILTLMSTFKPEADQSNNIFFVILTANREMCKEVLGGGCWPYLIIGAASPQCGYGPA